jgi:hypothetical protein
MFLAPMQILSQANIKVGPLLAGSGLAHDIGDTPKIAGLSGTGESMTLRRKVLPGKLTAIA